MAVLPDCDAEQAFRIIDEIRQQFSTISFAGDASEFHVSLSAGVASNPKCNANELLEIADRALYKAKNNGRNQIRLAENRLTAPKDAL